MRVLLAGLVIMICEVQSAPQESKRWLFERDMRGNMLRNVADEGFMIGLGRRKRSEPFVDDLYKRQNYLALADTGGLFLHYKYLKQSPF